MSCSMPQGHPSHCGCEPNPSIQRSFVKSDKPMSDTERALLEDNPRTLSEKRIADFLSKPEQNPTTGRHYKVHGKVCEKHPELQGIRYAKSRSCLGCREERRLQRMADLKEVPVLRERVKDLENQLIELQQAARRVLDTRDVDDDPRPTSYPSHDHNVPGVWNHDGSTCTQCQNYARLESLLPAGHRGPSAVVTPMLSDWLIRTPTTDNLLLAAETFFPAGLVQVIDGVAHIQHGLGLVVWAPTGDMEHAFHLAGRIHAKVHYDKGMWVQYSELGPNGEVVRLERVVEMYHGQGMDRALMIKIAQVAIYLAKCHKNRQ